VSGFGLYDVVKRSESTRTRYETSENLARQAFGLARDGIARFLADDMGLPVCSTCDPDAAFARFSSALDEANRQDLIGHGGVPERNFLALWLIAELLRPPLYVESGVFKGASVFSVASTGRARAIVGFDPNPSAWRARFDGVDVSLERHRHDFSEHDFGEVPGTALLYFDDHINSAKRIIEASEKGFRHLVFDDSCGLMGTSERMWPALPSLFFIMNIERFQVGDFVAWPRETRRERSFLGGRVSLRGRPRLVHNEFEITHELVELCSAARAVVKRCGKIPDLSDFIVTPRRLAMNDISQHFVVLA